MPTFRSIPFLLFFIFLLGDLAIANETEQDRLARSHHFLQSKLETPPLVLQKKGALTVGSRPEVQSPSTSEHIAYLPFDTIWVSEDTSFLLPCEDKSKYEGQYDIHEVYWQNGKVQAYVIRRYFATTESHMITKVYNREAILPKL